MAEWITILALVLVGMALIIIEVIFVPGTTFVGILGFIATAFGIYLTFVKFGYTAGWWVIGSTMIVFGVALYYSFKSNAWDRFSLKNTIDSKVNEGLTGSLKVGDEGLALSTIKPVGNADFGNVEYEVRSQGLYIESGTRIRIIKIEINNIFVEPIT